MSGVVLFKSRIAILLGVLLLSNMVPEGANGRIVSGGAGRNHRSAHLEVAPALGKAPALVAAAITTSTRAASPTQRYVAVAGTDANNNNCSNSSTPCLTIGHAITQSNPGDTINIGAGEYFENPTIAIDRDLTLQGAGASSTFLDGGGQNRVLEAYPGVTTRMVGLTVRNGLADTGAGIVTGGPLTVIDSVISGNQAIGGIASDGTPYDGYGGGIHSYSGTLTLIGTTVSDNQARGAGGSGVGGGIGSDTLIVSNSTVSGNTASGYGGGISTLNATLSNSTITVNSAGFSGGGAEMGGTGTIQLKNTVLAGNFDTGGAPDCEGLAASQGYNLIGNTNGCAFTSAAGDLQGTPNSPIDPKLGPLQNNGGATLTHAPLPGSPAIDAGSPSTPGGGGGACEPTDQIGTSRPQGISPPRCDIGAVEIFPTPSIDHLSRDTATAGDPAFQLTIFGANFVHGAKVLWNGNHRTTTVVSDVELRADITAADLGVQGTAAVTVVNPSPGGGMSNPAIFAINNPVGLPTPTIHSLSPSFAQVGSPGFTLTINGTEFAEGAKVLWNGSSREPALVSNQQVQLQISASDIAATGVISVTVVNPGGGTSNTLTFDIKKASTRLALLLRVPPPRPSDCNDKEPDNNYYDSIPLLANFGVECSGTFDDLLSDTADLYQISVKTQQTISIDLSNTSAQAEETLALYDHRLGQNYNTKALCVVPKIPTQRSGHIAYPAAAPGTYYIGVFRNTRSSPSPNTYLLRVSSDDNAVDCVPPKR